MRFSACLVITRSPLILPEPLEPSRRQLGIPHGVLNIAMSRVVLDGPDVVPVIGQFIPTGVPEHMEMERQGKAHVLPQAAQCP